MDNEPKINWVRSLLSSNLTHLTSTQKYDAYSQVSFRQRFNSRFPKRFQFVQYEYSTKILYRDHIKPKRKKFARVHCWITVFQQRAIKTLNQPNRTSKFKNVLTILLTWNIDTTSSGVDKVRGSRNTAGHWNQQSETPLLQCQGYHPCNIKQLLITRRKWLHAVHLNNDRIMPHVDIWM